MHPPSKRVLIAAFTTWTLVVAATAVLLHPISLQRWVDHRWAYERIEQHRIASGDSTPHDAYRQRVFGGMSDKDVARPIGFDMATAIPEDPADEGRQKAEMRVMAIRAVDSKFSSLSSLYELSPTQTTLLVAGISWAIPCIVIAVFWLTLKWIRGTTDN